MYVEILVIGCIHAWYTGICLISNARLVPTLMCKHHIMTQLLPNSYLETQISHTFFMCFNQITAMLLTSFDDAGVEK